MLRRLSNATRTVGGVRPFRSYRFDSVPPPASPSGGRSYYDVELLSHKALPPFLLGSLLVSTYFFVSHTDADLVAAAGPERGENAQVEGLFALYRYLELSTDGPRLELSELAALVDWRRLLAWVTPSRPLEGLVHSLYLTLMQGIDNTVALFPSVDIKPKLIRLGLLDTLEATLRPSSPISSSADAAREDSSTVRLCAAYCVNRLSRNVRVAQLLAGTPEIVDGLLALLDDELLIEDFTGRFVGFRHSDSHTSAEVACTLLEAVSNILEASGSDRSAVLLLLGGGAAEATTTTSSSSSPHPITGTRPASAAPLSPSLVKKLAALLRHLELCDEHTSNASKLFRDWHLAVYRRFFPHALDDEVRRRMREVEAEAARLLAAVATAASAAVAASATAAAGQEKPGMVLPAAAAVLLRRDVLQGLAPLAVSEIRNASAFVPAARALHAVLDVHDRAAAAGLVHPPSQSDEAGGLTDKSLLVDSYLNRRALAEAAAVAVDHPGDATLGAPFARLTSVGAMRLYTSSMAALVLGGCYGVVRTAMAQGRRGGRFIHPAIAYPVNGVGAVLLNLVIGQYGLRNAVRARTYIEDDATNVAWTGLQAGVDAGLMMAILRKHPYSLLPVLMINAVGHSSYPGTGLKALDGLDIFALG